MYKTRITIDMNGFTLRGEAGGGFDTPSGIGVDSFGFGGPVENIRILNGGLTGWPGAGIDLGSAQRTTGRHRLANGRASWLWAPTTGSTQTASSATTGE